jgi:hypothetical protein
MLTSAPRWICAFFVTAMVANIVATAATPPADDPDAHPPVTPLDLQIVRHARTILDAPAKWNRADDRKCPAEATTFSLYCALQKATLEAGRSFEHRGAALQEIRFVIDEITASREYEHRLMDYNNDPRTTFSDIQDVFRIGEELLVLRLRTDAAGTDAAKGRPAAEPAKQP